MSFLLSNLRLEGKKLLYQAKKPFNIFIEMGRNQEWLPELDSNQ